MTQQNDSSDKHSSELLKTDLRHAAVGGVVACAIILAGSLLIGTTSSAEAKVVLEGMLPAVRFLCSAVITAAATILALMLTMLSMNNSASKQFKPDYYERMRSMAWVNSAVLIGGTMLMLFVSAPLSSTDNIPTNWYTVIYYIVLVSSALLGSALITIVIMLYKAITGLIRVVHPNADSNIVRDQSAQAAD